jgi:hypothetical protein
MHANILRIPPWFKIYFNVKETKFDIIAIFLEQTPFTICEGALLLGPAVAPLAALLLSLFASPPPPPPLASRCTHCRGYGQADSSFRSQYPCLYLLSQICFMELCLLPFSVWATSSSAVWTCARMMLLDGAKGPPWRHSVSRRTKASQRVVKGEHLVFLLTDWAACDEAKKVGSVEPKLVAASKAEEGQHSGDCLSGSWGRPRVTWRQLCFC